MDEKINMNNCYRNIKNEFDKQKNKKIAFTNLIKSSQKSNSKISIFTKKKSNNKNKNSKKNKSINLKSKEICVNNIKKQILIKKELLKERGEKSININPIKDNFKSKVNNANKKKANKPKNIIQENKINSNISNFDNHNIQNQKNSHSSKKTNLKDSLYDSPIINKNSDDELVTSFERKPSELKSPDTVSEDSFITEEDPINLSKKDKNNKISNNENNNIENENIKKKEREKNAEINEEELIEQDNEIIYIDKMKGIDIGKEPQKQVKDKKKGNNNKSEINNIKVNVKTSFINEKEKNNFNNSTLSKHLNKNKNILNEKINSKDKSYKKKNKITLINKNNNKLIGAYIPVIQKSITVKKNQIINVNNLETKYSRNTSKNNQIDYLEPIQELHNNLSNHSLKFCSDKKFVNINNNKFKNKLKNQNNKTHKNLNQMANIGEDIIFHKKLKIDKENKDISSSNNKNTNISTSYNYTYKEEDLKNIKTQKENTPFQNIDNKEINNNNNTSNENNIKLIKDNSDKIYKSKQEIYYLKKNSHLMNKLALNIDDSNVLVNNSKKLVTNMSGNNIIYAPKKLGMTRVRSHEKKSENIYNNMSYDPNRIKKINNNIFKNNKNQQNVNSFCRNKDNYNQILLGNESGLNSLRFNLFNNQTNFYPINNGSFNENNNSLNYYNKSAEKPGGNNSIFMMNRLTNGDRININNFMQNPNFNKSLNFGININTDYNNYDMNMINNRSFVSKGSQYPIGYNLVSFSPFNNNISQTNLINLFNNNYLNFNTIQNKASSFINSYNLNDSLCSFNNNQNNSPSINIEDIIILQEKLKDIIIALNKTKLMANECFEFWNYYYNCSIYRQIEKLFTNPIESNLVRISINYELISIMVCYDYSFENDILSKTYPMLLDLIKLNYKNLIIICEHILSKISIESKNNIWVQKLKNIINSYKKLENIKYNNLPEAELINYNTNIIIQNLFFLLKNFKTLRNQYISNILNKIHDQSYEQINGFFREYILRTNNLKGSILASVFLRNNSKFSTLPAPYVRTKNNKEFSLVLDLDETLVHFKEQRNGENGGILKIRPGINEFLEEIGKYYELIVFTTATQDYADLLIDAVEEDKIYFDHRLYREHAVIIDNDFVKDLNRIGRPLEKIIIVDNMPQNFRLQKENGIMIKAYWGEDNLDTALSDLIPILVNIAKEGGDVRKGLEKYKDEILKKISLNIKKENS